MRFFHNYNVPNKPPYTDLITNVSLGIYGANNITQIAALRAAGGAYPFAQYWNGNGCQHGGMANLPLPLVLDPALKLKRNNIVGIEGGAELIRLLTDKREWFAQYAERLEDGRPFVVESVGRWAGNMYFNMLNTEVQTYWLQQLDKHMLVGASGVFLDNLSALGFTAMSGDLVTTATYGAGDSQAFLDSQLNWLKITHDHLTASGKKLYANISKSHKNPDYFKAMIQHLDGVMIEQAFSEQTLKSDLDLIQWLTANGKEVFIVASCKSHETAKIQCLTACYKLVENPLTYIRYSEDDYESFWVPQYARDVEQLLTPDAVNLQKQGEIATRRFYGGYAWVNITTRDSGIELQKPMPVTIKPWVAPIAYQSTEARDRETVQIHAAAAKGGALSYAIQSVPARDFRIYESGLITHSYSASGDYAVTVLVFEEGGGMNEISFVWSIRTPYDVKVTPLDNSGIEIEATKGGKLVARVQLPI